MSCSATPSSPVPENEQPRPWGSAIKPWGAQEIRRWWLAQKCVRSYDDSVLKRLDALPGSKEVISYGLANRCRIVKVGSWDDTKPKILITGGVHGYETGGVEAALSFLEKHVDKYTKDFDFAVFPCINPQAFEHDVRWNEFAQDTNRHCIRDESQTESGIAAPECVAFMDAVDSLESEFVLAIDLHETTNRDIELRQAKLHRDGKRGEANKVIPQGFYLVMNAGDEESRIGASVIEAVRQVTAIAPEPKILGEDNRGGVIYLDCEPYPGLCMNYTSACHRITTEVYPDIISSSEALAGQIAAIDGAIGFLRSGS